MRPRRWVHAVRMILGSVLGIIGLSTVSVAFAHRSTADLAVGLFEILLGAFVALGVSSPIQRKKAQK